MLVYQAPVYLGTRTCAGDMRAEINGRSSLGPVNQLPGAKRSTLSGDRARKSEHWLTEQLNDLGRRLAEADDRALGTCCTCGTMCSSRATPQDPFLTDS